MNFQELLSRINELDQPVVEEPNEGNAFTGALDAAKDAGKDEFEVDGKTFKVKEDDVEECGMMPPSLPAPAPKQSDSVTMNVSMNGSGAGGIKDLLNVLRNIESGDEPGEFGDADADVIIKKMAGEPRMPLGDDFANEPDEMYQGIDAVTGTGSDLHSKGIEKHAVAGGGNPMAVESLKERLSAHYQRIKGA